MIWRRIIPIRHVGLTISRRRGMIHSHMTIVKLHRRVTATTTTPLTLRMSNGRRNTHHGSYLIGRRRRRRRKRNVTCFDWLHLFPYWLLFAVVGRRTSIDTMIILDVLFPLSSHLMHNGRIVLYRIQPLLMQHRIPTTSKSRVWSHSIIRPINVCPHFIKGVSTITLLFRIMN